MLNVLMWFITCICVCMCVTENILIWMIQLRNESEHPSSDRPGPERSTWAPVPPEGQGQSQERVVHLTLHSDVGLPKAIHPQTLVAGLKHNDILPNEGCDSPHWHPSTCCCPNQPNYGHQQTHYLQSWVGHPVLLLFLQAHTYNNVRTQWLL